MPRKNRSNAASSSAAAENTATPTFTSFAAVTAQALGTYSDDAPTNAAATVTEWDSEALSLLKKLTKHDLVTKQRVLTALSTHLSKVPTDNPDAGAAFLLAWATAFPRLLLEESTPATHVTALEITATVIKTFGRATQPVLHTLLPAWVSAMGDPSPLVSDAASEALSSTFPAPDRQRKAALRYASHLREFCSDAIANYSKRKPADSAERSTSFVQPTKIVAVLQWLVTASDDLSTITPIVDEATNPLRTMYRATRWPDIDDNSTIRAIANLAIDIVKRTENARRDAGDDPELGSDEQSSQRLERIGNLAIAFGKTGTTVAWDLTLVLLREVTGMAVSIRNKLIDTLATAASATSPSAVAALLPVADALTTGSQSGGGDSVDSSLRRLISPLQKCLFPELKAETTVAFAVAILPSYIEILLFVQRVIANRCYFRHSAREAFLSDWTKDYVIPLCLSYVCGTTPSIAASRKVTHLLKPGSANDMSSSRNESSAEAQVAHAFGKLLKFIPDSELSKITPELAPAIIPAMNEDISSYILSRLRHLLDSISNALRERSVVTEMIISATPLLNPSNARSSVRLIAFVLNRDAAGNIPSTLSGFEENDVMDLTKRVAKFAHDSLRLAMENESSSGEPDEVSKDIASIFSWTIWSSRRCGKECDLTNSTMEELNNTCLLDRAFGMVSNIVHAHHQRMSSASFFGCAPLKGDALESLVRKALEILSSAEEMSTSARNFLSVTTRGNGGATLSPEVIQEAVQALLGRLTKTPEYEENPEFAEFDPLISSLLTSPVQHLDLYSGDFDALASASIFRAAYSKEILSSILTRISSAISTEGAKTTVERFIQKFVKYSNHSPCGGDREDLGTVFAEVAKTLWERDTVLPVTLFSRLLHTGPVLFLCSFLDNVSLQVIFGDGSKNKVDIENVMKVFELTNASGFPEMLPRLQNFFTVLDEESLLAMSSKVTEMVLRGPHFPILRVLELLCSVRDDHNTLKTAPYLVIAEEIKKHVCSVRLTSDTDGSASIPHVVHSCMFASKGKFVESANDLLVNMSNVIRRDPAAPSSLILLDAMSALLSYHVESGSTKISGWWRDLSLLVLRAVRRCLEQPKGLSKAATETFEKHCACYIYHHVKVLGETGVTTDDVRFWVFRTRDILQKVMQRLNAEGEAAISTEHDRIAWFYNVGLVLLDFIDTEDEKYVMPADEISHCSAWSGIYCVPTLVPLQDISNSVGSQELKFSQAGPEGWAGLTLRAAERGVLLGKQGEIGVEGNDVYDLIPWLGCRTENVRKAVLILVAHAGAVDLPMTIENTFPEHGLLDGQEEEVYAIQTVPKAIRESLIWMNIHNFENREEVELAELKYFLTWRLFFDLVAANDDHPPGSTNEQKCFKYVGFLFLRSQPDLTSDFFRQCANVIVHGSIIEKRAGSLGAREILQVPERAKQGIQLVEENSNADGTPADRDQDVGSGSDESPELRLEKEIGRAAGIAFTRALQRAPALSRAFIGNRIDRGTMTHIESFVRRFISPQLVVEEVRKVEEWGAFGGKGGQAAGTASESEGELKSRGSVAGRSVWATYSLSDVHLEIKMHIPDIFPLGTVRVEADSRSGMSESRWRKTLLEMTTLLQARDGSLAEAVGLWKRNLDKCFQGIEECPICYSVLHLKTAAVPEMQCKTCKKLFHSACLYRWFKKSNSRACPLCRSAFLRDFSFPHSQIAA